MDSLQSLWFLPFLLYAETHYRFKYFFSILRKSEPEIIADAPHRLEPGPRLPILIIIKDAHLFPCTLEQVTTELRKDGEPLARKEHLATPLTLGQKFKSFTIPLDVSSWRGWIEVDVTFSVNVGGVTKEYHNDNHRFSSRAPLRVFLASDPLPRFANLYLGDPHVHSTYTDDQVEFGSPLSETRELARAMGLSFFCVTDHSYDLDDCLDSYLENDPGVPKWKMLQSEVDILNRTSSDCIVVRGEEVSCLNSVGKNVHLLMFGQREFIHGSGDGAEWWFRTKSEFTIPQALALRSEGGATYAAHPMESVPFLQRLLLGRGEWSDEDLCHEGLSGVQIMNGKLDEGFRKGLRSWTRHLLNGDRLHALAGNDAHGNFNRFRQIGVPFLALRETAVHVFGKMRTGLFVDGGLTEQSVQGALSQGRSILTDGPIARLAITSHSDSRSHESNANGPWEAEIEIRSTAEFGRIASVRLIVGKVGNPTEQIAYEQEGVNRFDFQIQVVIKAVSADYARVEVHTGEENSSDGLSHFCFTNPAWFRNGSTKI
jgi:hypothetical protein